MTVLVTDSWTAADATAWDSVIWPVQRDAIDSSPASPTPDVQGNVGMMYTTTGDRRYLCATAITLPDVDITVKWTPITTGVNIYAEIGYRVGTGITTGTPDSGYALSIIVDSTESSGHVYLRTINSYDVIAFQHDVPLDDMAARFFRVRVRGTRHRVKWWLAADSEPPFWLMDVEDATYSDGRSFLGLYNNGTAATTVAWDNFQLEEIIPAPEGIHVLGNFLPVDELYVGDEPVVACWRGSESIDIPTP